MDFSVSREGIKSALEDTRRKHFFTTFDHLNAHYGIRKGCYSVYMGSTGSGKSSLLKTIGIQASTTPDVNVLFWLSEEKKEKYARGMDAYCERGGADLSRIRFFEESSIDSHMARTHADFLNHFREVVAASGADIVIIDNITSSRFYGPRTSMHDQGETVQFLKEFSAEMDIAIVVVIHTSSKVSDNMGRLFTTEDVRGLRSISIEASYFYAIQKFTRNDQINVFLRTLKHRDHDMGGGSYLLVYDPGISLYVGDVKVDFSAIKKIFDESDRLKR